MIDTDAEVRESETIETDILEPESDESETQVDSDSKAKAKPREKTAQRRQITITLRGLGLATTIIALVGAAGLFASLYIGAKRQVDDDARLTENKVHAEKVALDYAVAAAAMNFQDMDGWKSKLTAGTSTELKHKLTNAATSMEQILVPLQWSSTARPLAAKVRSVNGGTYVVDSFVSVLTKTMQAPEALQSTATYSVTIDSNKGWEITDVGGVGEALSKK